MSSLEKLQHDFISNIINDKSDQKFFGELRTGKLTPEIQLSIYQRNYSGSIQKTMQQIYPACFSILGEEYFHTLCRSYQRLHHSTDSNLNNYGYHFNTLLQKECIENTHLRGFEYLHDLALLEWHWHACYYSSNGITFDFKGFSEVQQDQQSNVTFDLNISLSHHTSAFPLIDIWKDNTSQSQTSATNEYSMPENSIYYCIYQHNLIPAIDVVDRNIYTILTAIKNKIDLQSLCHYDGIEINQVLSNLLQKDWITGFTLMDKTC